MAGDYTRFTFDPVKGYSGVLKQQGRVSLDSAANEFEEILDRRDRAEMYDTVGQAVYPIAIPTSFQIGVGLGGKLTIGQGRLYIDGILAECFGDMTDPANAAFDANMNDLVGINPLFFDQQPFLYSPTTLPIPAYPALSPIAGTSNLVYLDVWQREVTVFEEYGLREIALNGPDTDTRMQTAWQVKAIDAGGAATCAAPLAAWDALILPSTARLTATATPAAPAPGPCVINPAGGYTGLENRLYRVEIHRAGTVDGAVKAQFKWSRDNASLAARVLSTTKVTATDWIITVGSTGRDSWMRFEFGDHVELLDDNVEFAMRESGTGGIMAKVTSVNHATGEIHVDQDLTAIPIVAGRHARIRRWDIATAAETFTRNTNNGVAIPLESGITVTFGLKAADTLHAGDFWVFAARTADGSIDSLVKQPPRNILHHFAKLALVTSGAPPVVVSDCRTPWPPPTTAAGHEGCCSQVVKVGEDIQKAIDALSPLGGCVCLKMGTHHIKKPLQIKQDNVTIHGEVPWVTVQLDAGGPLMLEIAARQNVSVEGILFEAPNGMKHVPMIAVGGVTGGRIANCGLRITGEKANPVFQAIGIELTRCHEYSIDCVQMTDLPFGVSGLECSEIGVLDSRLDGPAGTTAAGDAVSFGAMGIEFEGGNIAGIYVERNILADYQRGVQFGDISDAAIMPGGGAGNPVKVDKAADGCRIAANDILRNPGVPPKIGGVAPVAFAIATHVARCEIVENAMHIAALDQYGILVAGGNTLVHRNEVRSDAAFDPAVKTIDQIPIGVTAIETQADALLCSIRGNLFTGLQQAVFATGASSGGSHRVDILDNRIEGVEVLVSAALTGKLLPGSGSPIVKLLAMLERFSAIAILELTHCRIADNEITHSVCGVTAAVTLGTSVIGNRVSSSLAGVILLAAVECEVGDNIIDASLESAPTIGVGLFLVDRSVAARNAVSRCAQGILSVLCTALRVQDNDVYDTDTGIGSVVDVDLELRGNNVEDASQIGISVLYSFHELTLAHDRTLRCGYRDTPAFSPSPAIGIEIVLSVSLVTVEGCHVIDTGESANAAAPVFTAPRFGIVVKWAIGARIRGCEVASKPLVATTGVPTGVNGASRAIQMWTLPQAVVISLLGTVGRPMVPFADATDNVIEQSCQTLVEIISYDEIMFATNRCIDFVQMDQVTVLLAGLHATVTGNRVTGGTLSFGLFFKDALSAVGNMTTGNALLVPGVGAVQMPAPYTAFNAIA